MSNIDNAVVAMHFDNDEFERRLATTIDSLDKLRHSIDNASSAQGFDNLSNIASSFDVSSTSMSSAIQNISEKFTALGAIGFSVIQSLTQSALAFVEKVGGDVVGPILSGGKNRAENIQQAQFMFRGLGIDVDSAMQSALDAVKGTSYGLDEAAKAAAQFGASGIQAGDKMTSALRGVAGAAALTGSSFSEIAAIFAGSAGSGKVNTLDLQQFSTRGLNAAAAIAPILGKTEAQVRDMASSGALDFKTFADAMDKAFGAHAKEANQLFSGSLANLHAAMSRLGASFFGTELFQLRDIFNSLSPVVDSVNAALQPLIKTFLDFGGEKTFKIVTFLQNLNFDNFRAGVLYVSAGLQNLHRLLDPIAAILKYAFREVFPAGTESLIVKITRAFEQFTERIQLGDQTLDKLHSIFRGLFSVISIGMTIVKDALGLFKALLQVIFTQISPGGSGVLGFFAHLGDSLFNLKKTLVDGGGIRDFFVKTFVVLFDAGKYIENFLVSLDKLKDKLSNLFGSDTTPNGVITGAKGTEDALGRVGQRLDQLRDAIEKIGGAFDRLGGNFDRVRDVLSKLWEYISTWFGELGSKIAAAFKPGDFDSAIDIVNVGLLGGIVVMLKKFLDGDILKKLGGNGVINSIKRSFNELTTTLGAMQAKLKSETLMKIAEAVGILTLSVVAMSLIDSAKLTKALTAISIGFAEMISVMTLLDKLVSSNKDAAKLAVLGGAMIEFSTAMVIFTGAVALMSRLSLAEIGKGLVGIAGGLAILIGASHLMSTSDSLGMIAAGVGMTALSAGLIVLSVAVKLFSTLSWGEMAKGLVGVAAGLTLVTLAMNFMPPSGAISGIGVIEIATGLVILAKAVKEFGSLDWGVMGKGLLGIAGALTIVATAMSFMPLSLPVTAAGMVILSGALIVMSKAISILGNLDMRTLAKGIGGLAAAMIILVAAMIGAEGGIAGAAALVIMAGALVIITDVIEKIGNLDTDVIIRGIVGMAATLVILAGAALLLSPIVPLMIALAIAVGVLGAAFVVLGIGALLIAESMDKFAKTGVAATTAFIDSTKAFLGEIPNIVTSVILGFVKNIDDLLAAVPLLTRLIQAILDQLLDTIIKLAPKLGEAIVVLATVIFKVLRAYYPDLIKTGFEILQALLHGISDNIGEIVSTVVDLIINFIKALSDKIPDLVDAWYHFLLTVAENVARKLGEGQTAFIPIAQAFIEGFLKGLRENSESIRKWFVGLPGNIIGWIGNVAPVLYDKGVSIIEGFLKGIVEKAIDIEVWFVKLPVTVPLWLGSLAETLVPQGIDLLVGLLTGILVKAGDLIDWFTGLPERIVGWLGDVSSRLKEAGQNLLFGLYIGILEKASDVISWFQGLPDRIIGWIGDIAGKLKDAGIACIQGIIDGLSSMKDSLIDKAKDVFGWLTNPIGALLEWHSPSKYMRRMGVDVMNGLIFGLNDMHDPLTKISKQVGKTMTDLFKPSSSFSSINNTISSLVDKLGAMDNLHPTITPVVDLTNVIDASKRMGELIKSKSPTISFDATLHNAKLAELSDQVRVAGITPTAPTPPQDVTFIQNNHSPEALSTNDIYRKTKSQLILAKEELGIAS